MKQFVKASLIRIQRIIYLFVLVILVIHLKSCTNFSNKKNDWTEMNLYGKVKSINEVTYEVVEKNGEIEKGSKSQFYDCTYFLFNNGGNIIEQKIYFPDENLKSRQTTNYDEKGNKIEEKWYRADGSLESKHTFNNDENGNVTSGEIYNSDGSLYREYNKRYDEKGNEIEENGYNARVRLNYKLVYQYDNNGNEIECKLYHHKGLKYKFTNEYDNEGNRIKDYVYDANGSIISKHILFYDDKKSLIEENWYISDGSLEQKLNFSYEYDNKGNWIFRVDYYNEIPKKIIEREIEYFD